MYILSNYKCNSHSLLSDFASRAKNTDYMSAYTCAILPDYPRLVGHNCRGYVLLNIFFSYGNCSLVTDSSSCHPLHILLIEINLHNFDVNNSLIKVHYTVWAQPCPTFPPTSYYIKFMYFSSNTSKIKLVKYEIFFSITRRNGITV